MTKSYCGLQRSGLSVFAGLHPESLRNKVVLSGFALQDLNTLRVAETTFEFHTGGATLDAST